MAFAALLTSAEAVGRPQGQSEDALVTHLLQSLSAEEKVGQLFMVGFRGPEMTPEARLVIQESKVGGVYISRENCNVINGPANDPTRCEFSKEPDPDTPGQVANLTNQLQQTSCEVSKGSVEGVEYCIPLLTAVDHEGDGRPQARLINRFTAIPSNMAIGATFDPRDAEAVGCIVGRELAAVGVNMLLGPDLDVLESPRSGGAGDQGVRVFGGDPHWVGEMGTAYVKGVHGCGGGRVATVAKHFPGHGRSTRGIDYEDVPVVVGRTLEQLRQLDLVPFLDVSSASPGTALVTDAIMNSHLSYPEVVGCGERVPVTFSPGCMQAFTSLQGIATWRQDGGLTVSDDLASGAVVAYAREKFGGYPPGEIAFEALMAGNDLLPLISPWQWQALPATISYLTARYRAEEPVRVRVDDAVKRILSLKIRLYGGLDPKTVMAKGDTSAVGIPEGAAKVDAITAKSMTFIKPATREAFSASVPPPTPSDRILFVECWDDPACSSRGPDDAADYPPLWPGGRLKDLTLQMYAGRVVVENLNTISFSQLGAILRGEGDSQVKKAIEEADWLVFGYLEPDPGYRDSTVLQDFLGRGSSFFDLRRKKIAVFAYNSPYHFDAGQVRNMTLFIALYGKIESALRQSLKALFQDPMVFQGRNGLGSLPVSYILGGWTAYDLAQQIKPEPSQAMLVSIDPEEPVPGEEFVIRLDQPLLARNGHRVVNGTEVAFTLDLPDGTRREVTASTVEGLAEVSVTSAIAGDVRIAVTSGGAGWSGVQKVEAPPREDAREEVRSGEGGSAGLFLIGSGVGLAAALAAGGLGALMLRRRGGPEPEIEPPAGAERRAPPGAETELHVDSDGRIVYVKGKPLLPPLSREQHDLLTYLYENAGRICSREEIVGRVWPDAAVTGVSEEALDSLLHRVRERLVSAGAPRRLIVTVRGRGYRLDLVTKKEGVVEV